MAPIRLHAWNGRCAHTSRCGRSGTLHKCAHPHSHTEGVHARSTTALRHPSRYTYGQVERWSCLIRLQARWPRIDIFAWVFQAIGREIARPRHILYAYANRPRLPPSLCPFVCPFVCPVSSRFSLVFLRCNTTCTNKTALFDPIPLPLSPFRLVWSLSVLGAIKPEMFLVIACAVILEGGCFFFQKLEAALNALNVCYLLKERFKYAINIPDMC